MRKLALIATLAATAFPAAALGADPPSSADKANAAKACEAQRAAMGVDAFRALYGPLSSKSNAFGNCVSKLARAEQQNRENAAKQCTAERNDPNFAAGHDGKTFAQLYGRSGANAYGKCVAAKARAASQAQQQATIKAAKACKAERAADLAAFKAKYAPGESGANAFGKCVSAKAKTR